MVWEIVMFIVCFIAGLMLLNVRTIIDILADIISEAIDLAAADKAKAKSAVCTACGRSRRKPSQKFCSRCGARMTTLNKS
jgi:uncharacterized paraquat-inducible protein A